MADIAASILAKLKNKAKNEGIPLQQLLNLFCQEEFIRRLSGSKYKKNLILKGGFLLYSISEFTARPTIDADYLLKNSLIAKLTSTPETMMPHPYQYILETINIYLITRSSLGNYL